MSAFFITTGILGQKISGSLLLYGICELSLFGIAISSHEFDFGTTVMSLALSPGIYFLCNSIRIRRDDEVYGISFFREPR